DGGRRNPFFQFLAHFRACNREELGNLPASFVSVMGSMIWNEMTSTQKAPYLKAARKADYTFMSRCAKANWVLRNLREYMAARQCHANTLWTMMNVVRSWTESVMIHLDDSED
ncbi:hypothetical protein KR018_001959, partial [Drosophila ironensis]